MAWWSRLGGRGAARTRQGSQPLDDGPQHGGSQRGGSQLGAVQQHLADFTRSRTGVEGYLEPATTITPTTLVLVAGDGEWTRRPVPDVRSAERFARDLGVPVFDVNQSGYPSRMREWNARVNAEGAAPRRETDGG